MKNLVILTLLILVLVAKSMHAQEGGYSLKKSYSIKNSDKLEIIADYSDVEILTHEKDSIAIYYTCKEKDSIVKVSTNEIDENVIIKHLKHQKKFLIQLVTPNNNFNLISSIKIYIPKKLAVAINSISGNLVLNGLCANQYCHSKYGNIQLINSKGRVIAVTLNGNVTLTNVTALVDCHIMGNRFANTETKTF